MLEFKHRLALFSPIEWAPGRQAFSDLTTEPIRSLGVPGRRSNSWNGYHRLFRSINMLIVLNATGMVGLKMIAAAGRMTIVMI